MKAKVGHEPLAGANAIAHGSFRERRVPVALNLTPIDPVVAEWLMAKKLQPRKVTQTYGGSWSAESRPVLCLEWRWRSREESAR